MVMMTPTNVAAVKEMKNHHEKIISYLSFCGAI